MVATLIDLAIVKNDEKKSKMKVLHRAWTYSFKQIFEGTIKIFIITRIKVLQICIGLKNYVLRCFEGIAQSYKNLDHVKYASKVLH
jgi:hypothetical protein